MRLACSCGQLVYFNNLSCNNCGRLLAYDPEAEAMRSGDPIEGGIVTCTNRDGPVRCNWIADEVAGSELCLSCNLTRIIPVLSKPENEVRWRKLEEAKRRLLVDLVSLGLPVRAGRLSFVFKEDRRTNPDVREHHVNIGHLDGVITINAAEADDVYREKMRAQMNEPVRTLLGHMRHESGHYFFSQVVGADLIDRFRSLFGDERADYRAALQRYYHNGPQDDWRSAWISPYASAHPAEDWAECWSHYLQIRAVLNAAVESGNVRAPGPDTWIQAFAGLILGVNDIMRSLGRADAYPYVITADVARKLEFVHDAIAASVRRL